MAKLTKRVVESLESDGSKHGTLYWDTELKGFGVRVFSTGLKTFVIKFRTRSGRQRWLKIGTYGTMTAEQARDRALVELAKVISGEDPADDRDQLSAAVTVVQLCDHYMTAGGPDPAEAAGALELLASLATESPPIVPKVEKPPVLEKLERAPAAKLSLTESVAREKARRTGAIAEVAAARPTPPRPDAMPPAPASAVEARV
jgi:hypothetical protein